MRWSKGDASLSPRGWALPALGTAGVLDIAVDAVHAFGGPGDCSSSAARLRAEIASGPPRRSPRSNRRYYDRSAGRERLADGREHS